MSDPGAIPDPVQPGTLIGRYEVVECLGSGPVGDVYKVAVAGMPGRIAALKLLSAELSGSDRARSRFEREVRTAAKLDHPGIVAVHDQGEHQGRPFFVMDYVEGRNLSSIIADTEPRSLEGKVEIAAQISEALHVGHENAVIHRGLKPANILVFKDGGDDRTMIVDFGISRREIPDEIRAEDRSGSHAYMSPEQLRNDSTMDHRSDLFALGIVLYQLFTGVHPFEASGEAPIRHRILKDGPESPRKHNPGVPSPLEALILRLLEKNPARRPQTAGEVGDALRQILRRLETRSASPESSAFDDLDEVTRDGVEREVSCARRKESEGALDDALCAYERAATLAPQSERIERKLRHLRQRIESNRMLGGYLDSTREALSRGDVGGARDAWRQAWVLNPESQEVAALETRIREADATIPIGRERYDFVTSRMTTVEEELERGNVNEARGRVMEVLQRYPDDPLANMSLERVLAVAQSGVDYKEYRARLRAARAALEAGRIDDAKTSCDGAASLWPDDEEVRAIRGEIESRAETAAAEPASPGAPEASVRSRAEIQNDLRKARYFLEQNRRGELRALVRRLRSEVESAPDLRSFLPEIAELGKGPRANGMRRQVVWVLAASVSLIAIAATVTFVPRNGPDADDLEEARVSAEIATYPIAAPAEAPSVEEIVEETRIESEDPSGAADVVRKPPAEVLRTSEAPAEPHPDTANVLAPSDLPLPRAEIAVGRPRETASDLPTGVVDGEAKNVSPEAVPSTSAPSLAGAVAGEETVASGEGRHDLVVEILDRRSSSSDSEGATEMTVEISVMGEGSYPLTGKVVDGRAIFRIENTPDKFFTVEVAELLDRNGRPLKIRNPPKQPRAMDDGRSTQGVMIVE